MMRCPDCDVDTETTDRHAPRCRTTIAVLSDLGLLQAAQNAISARIDSLLTERERLLERIADLEAAIPILTATITELKGR